jgi:hypothetical protein
MMKSNMICLAALIFFVMTSLIGAQDNNFPVLTGPYLGQTLPVNEPVIFAPGIVSYGGNHSSLAISPDGRV